ncbi:MAG: ADP-heptose--LPS heptosyltransferase [Phycisphaerae bacterium]|nr:MAG: ADP-heptose--LPS heptosyltransferase [Phycisphaerae bacterium]
MTDDPPLAAPHRLLIVLPSWVGDAVMATPTLRAVRQAFPGIFIGGLCRPGIDEVLAGTPFFDELHVERAQGVMGPKFVAAKVRPRRYDTALLLTNSFSTALIVRIAGIPRRIGYDRDARGLLLTDKMKAARRGRFEWAPVSAVEYYWSLASRFLLPASRVGGAALGPLELALTPAQRAAGEAILAAAGVGRSHPLAVLVPGGNNPAKHWPLDHYAAMGSRLLDQGWDLALNGSPGERDLTARLASILAAPPGRVADLAAAGITPGSLKAVVASAGLMIANDTGPRHIAAAFGVPLVSLFGPTDHRWTTIPTRPEGPEAIVLADPTLPAHEVANDHPTRCAMHHITVERVWQAVQSVLARRETVTPPRL